MTIRLPLYGKILAWFFLNLVVVVVVFAALFDAQFHTNLDWLFAAGARDRLEAVRDLIIGELETTPPDDWGQVMQRYSEAHRVRFALFDDEANPLIGDPRELPAEVRARILERPTFAPPPRDTATTLATPREFSRRWPRPPVRALMRTTEPTQYWLLASARLDNPLAGGPMRVVLVAKSDSISAGGLIFNPKPWLMVGAGVFVFSLLFWLPLVRGITRTIARMMHATRQIADGRFEVRLNLHRRDEIGSLAEAIDQMAVHLDGLVRGQKRFLGDIAHELCSPLARLQMALGILEQRVTGEDAAFLRAASEKAEQIAALVGELLSFSKASFGASAVRLEPVRVAAVVAEALRREEADAHGFRVEVAEDLWVSADPELLTRAVANLLRNSLQHAPEAAPISIRAARSGEEVSLVIADDGPGVPEAELPRLFDAFYRVDASRTRETGGTGLGLAIVKTCVESCSGTVTAHNREPHGLEMRLTLHASPAPLAPGGALDSSAVSGDSPETSRRA
jgi:two-component system sensor histidine kinase CpxA